MKLNLYVYFITYYPPLSSFLAVFSFQHNVSGDSADRKNVRDGSLIRVPDIVVLISFYRFLPVFNKCLYPFYNHASALQSE